MPIYVYRCDACSEVTEALQKLNDAPLSVCPACGNGSMRKLIAPAGVIFKGSGFHVNDYGGNGRRAASGATEAAKPAPAPEKKADAGGEKKATTESKVA